MPAQIIPLFKSGEGRESISDPEAPLVYAVVGEHNEVAVRTLVESTIPSTYLGLSFSDYQLKHYGNGLWEITVTYGTQKLSNLGDIVTSFDTTGGTRHITQSLQTTAYPLPGETAPTTFGCIGIEGNGAELKINGVDIPGPAQFKFQITKSWPVGVMDQAKILAIAEMTYKTNTDTFYLFAPGTLMFLGASGSQRGIQDWEVTYFFGFNRNATNLTVGSITGISKKGWEYLWCLYRPFAVGVHIVMLPVCVFVEKVADAAAFSTLGV